jgi:hypothetical protein
MKRTFLVAVALAFSGAALAQQYKWVDKDGRTRYGDVPPPGVNVTRLKGPTPPSAPPPATKDAKGPLTPAERDAAFRKRQEEAQKEREKQELASRDAQAKKENCARAQDHVRTIESGQRLSRTDSKGERQYLDESQVAQELAKARQTAQEWCK